MAETLILPGLSVWLVAKIFVLLALAIYIVFAVVIIRQIYLMVDTTDIGFSLPIKTVGWTHLLFAVGIFVFALITL